MHLINVQLLGFLRLSVKSGPPFFTIGPLSPCSPCIERCDSALLGVSGGLNVGILGVLGLMVIMVSTMKPLASQVLRATTNLYPVTYFSPWLFCEL